MDDVFSCERTKLGLQDGLLYAFKPFCGAYRGADYNSFEPTLLPSPWSSFFLLIWVFGMAVALSVAAAIFHGEQGLGNKNNSDHSIYCGFVICYVDKQDSR